ncbi:hypothetical protein PVAP13_1NG022636 [Panicum virgatum]|uniref:Uncharacterized protein n=1 Tax=Panicum virgatum TaxID=38727 RepID=A0A8T0WZ89_PANVG|nr:hypothetical protein PVAP13_1NG022636 [Panicum virgatum]
MSPSQRDLEIHRFFLLSQKIPSSLSLSSSSPRKCSQNPTTGADKSHKPNHLQLVKSSSASTSPGIPAPAGETSGDPRLGSKNLTARTRKQRKAPPPLLDPRPLRCGGRTVSGLASTSSPSFSSPHRETRGERPAVAEQGEEDVSPLLTSSLSAAAVVPRPLSGTYRQRATEQDAAVRPDLSPPRWRFLGGRLL